MSESIPSSITSFAHRRPRADSTTSFAYFQESEEPEAWPEDEAVEEESEEESGFAEWPEGDLESGQLSPLRRKSSGFSRSSAENPLLRQDSSKTDTSGYGQGGKVSQKIYILTEDLTIVVAGFTANLVGFAIYIVLCAMTLGLGYLLFRWLPRWRVRLTGSPAPLRECTWVVIEVSLLFSRNRLKTSANSGQNQWGEFTVHDVMNQQYGHALSTVFGSQEKGTLRYYDDDDDPVINHLRFVDYRYIRFSFHPLKDKFVLSNSWKDPSWTNVKSIRAGLDGDEQEYRQRVFGKNLIGIQEKTVPQLLVDEVRPHSASLAVKSLTRTGFSSFLCLSSCQLGTVVLRRVLLLRGLHFRDICC